MTKQALLELFSEFLSDDPKNYRLYKRCALVHKGALIKESAYVERGAFIDASVYVGHDVRIREGSVILYNTIINDNAEISNDCVVGTPWDLYFKYDLLPVSIPSSTIIPPRTRIGRPLNSLFVDGYFIAECGSNKFQFTPVNTRVNYTVSAKKPLKNSQAKRQNVLQTTQKSIEAFSFVSNTSPS